MLRAYLTGDDAEYERLTNRPDPVSFQDGFSALVTTAFVQAVHRRFGQNRMLADVIQFVAQVRARYLNDPHLLDPYEAEKLIWAALGDQQVAAELNDEAKARGQLLLLPALIDEQNPDQSGIDELLTAARNQAENLPG
jgi:hypothetical protein